jgi:hypothetical protein
VMMTMRSWTSSRLGFTCTATAGTLASSFIARTTSRHRQNSLQYCIELIVGACLFNKAAANIMTAANASAVQVAVMTR